MAFETARAIVKGHIAGVVATRNMFTGEAEVVAPDDWQDLAGGYVNRFFGHLMPIVSPLWTMETIQVQVLFAGKWEDRSEFTNSNNGSGTGDILPNSVAVVLIGKALGLRRIGRKFIAGVTEANVTGNLLVGTAVAAVADALTDYITLFTTAAGSTWQPGILDKTGTFRSFQSGFVSALLGTMRRRKPGLGI